MLDNCPNVPALHLWILENLLDEGYTAVADLYRQWVETGNKPLNSQWKLCTPCYPSNSIEKALCEWPYLDYSFDFLRVSLCKDTGKTWEQLEPRLIEAMTPPAKPVEQHDLSFVSLDDLIKEVLKRSDHGVIRLIIVRSEDDHEHVLSWRGNSHVIMGLCVDVQGAVLDEFRKDKDKGSDDVT
jgi:hypothetical protein